MKLSQPQIQELYQFTRKHFVEWYDLQTELVDHLAQGIEQQWKENPKLSFEQTLQREFKKFGVFGFMDVVEQRQKALGKRYLRIMLGYAKAWFQLPKILTTITLFLSFYLLIKSNLGLYFIYAITAFLMVYESVVLWKLKKKSKKRISQNKKKWMFEDIIFNTATANALFLVSQILSLSLQTSKEIGFYKALFFAAILTAAIIYSHITLIVIPSKAEKLLEETYPEYKFAS